MSSNTAAWFSSSLTASPRNTIRALTIHSVDGFSKPLMLTITKREPMWILLPDDLAIAKISDFGRMLDSSHVPLARRPCFSFSVVLRASGWPFHSLRSSNFCTKAGVLISWHPAPAIITSKGTEVWPFTSFWQCSCRERATHGMLKTCLLVIWGNKERIIKLHRGFG